MTTFVRLPVLHNLGDAFLAISEIVVDVCRIGGNLIRQSSFGTIPIFLWRKISQLLTYFQMMALFEVLISGTSRVIGDMCRIAASLLSRS